MIERSRSLPVERANFGRATLEVPVSPLMPKPALHSFGNDDLGPNPILAVLDCRWLARLLSRNRPDLTIDDLRNEEPTDFALHLIPDLFLPDTKETAHED